MLCGLLGCEAKFSLEYGRGDIDPSLNCVHGEKTTREELVSRGFSSGFIKLFFEPFFGGVFLERNLATAASVFEFTFAMFSSGRACLPAGGMSSIPQQMAKQLPATCLQTDATVVQIKHSLDGWRRSSSCRWTAVLCRLDYCFQCRYSKLNPFFRRCSDGMATSLVEGYPPRGFRVS